MPITAQRARLELIERLQMRRAEIEQAALLRVQAVPAPVPRAGSGYAEGLRGAISAAVGYALAGIEQGQKRLPPIPVALLAQARLAVRSGVSLDTVLRRYLAGYTLLGDFLLEEAQRDGGPAARELKRLLRAQAALFERLLAAVSDEYTRESRVHVGSAEQRRAERVQGLLDGELVDTAEFAYDFAAEHLALLATGPQAAEAIRNLAAGLDRLLLLVPQREGVLWAWLGGRRRLSLERLEGHLREVWPKQTSLAVGEPAAGIAGWRLTHRQAKAALPIALRARESFVRYGDVALLAATLGDDLFATSLRELYLAPLALERDGGEALRRTLRAYFAAERNVSSAAAAIGVSRQTVINRLRMTEERLGRPLAKCAAEVEAALRLDDLGRPVVLRRLSAGKLSSVDGEFDQARVLER